MAQVVVSQEVVSKNSAMRLFLAGCKDIHKVGLAILPEIYTGISLHGGDGDVGTVILFNFTEAVPYRYIKERVDELDKENFECVYSVVEGGVIGIQFKSMVYRMKLTPQAEGGCVFKLTGQYEPLPDLAAAEEIIKTDMERSMGIFMAVDAYLTANPDAYA